MSMNYYLEQEKCVCCGRSDPPLHIGKSSVGWTFALHIYPELGIRTLNDWVSLFHDNDIVDMYGKPIPASVMILIITEREKEITPELERAILRQPDVGCVYKGLARRVIDGFHCIGYGNGTYDFCIGDFS